MNNIVVLEVKEHNMEKPFSIEHAERLLRMDKNGGWELPKDSPYEFKDNAIRIKRDKRNNQEPKEQRSDPEIDKPAKRNKISHRDEPK